MAAFLPRFLWTLAVLVFLIVFGTLGYVWIEGQPLSDALYMTVITLTAVGYSEVFDLTPTGRTFTIFLLLCGISWMGFWFANITSFIVELDLKDALKRRHTMREIAKMRGEPQRQRRKSHGVGGSQAVGVLLLRYRHSPVGPGAASRTVERARKFEGGGKDVDPAAYSS